MNLTQRIYQENLENARKEWQARANKSRRPAGEVSHDSQGKMHFTPSTSEAGDCCKGIEDTKLFQHCKTVDHLADLFDVLPGDLSKIIRRKSRARNGVSIDYS